MITGELQAAAFRRLTSLRETGLRTGCQVLRCRLTRNVLERE
tara:strand:+ start:417 stop:542 length:126 start_codon:yes stop_codon:yes gene_type:complete